MLAGSRLDVISSDCNAYYVTRLEHLTSSLPSSLSAAQQLLPKEASTVAQFLHSTSQSVLLPHNHCFDNHTQLHAQYVVNIICFLYEYRNAKCTSLFQHPNFTDQFVYICTPHCVLHAKPVHVLCVCDCILCSFYKCCVGDSVHTARLSDFRQNKAY